VATSCPPTLHGLCQDIEDRSSRDFAVRHVTLVRKLRGFGSRSILRSENVEGGGLDYIEHDVRAGSNEGGILFGNRHKGREQDEGCIAKRVAAEEYNKRADEPFGSTFQARSLDWVLLHDFGGQ